MHPLHCTIHSDIISSKIHRGLDNFEKNTGTTHPSVVKRVGKRDGKGDPLTDDNSVLWYGEISVGTPAETFKGKFSFHA